MTARFQRRLGASLLLLGACADVPAGATEAPTTTDPGTSTAMETGTQTSADPPPASTDTTATSGDSTGESSTGESSSSDGSSSESSSSESSSSESSSSESSSSESSSSESSSSESSSSGGESCEAGDGPAFTVGNSGVANYSIDGVGDPPLTVVRGCSYTFAIDAPGHPFWIKTVQSTGVGNAYGDGVTGNGTDDGVITWDVSAAAPDSLFYNCEIHGMMTGTITVIDP